MSERIGIIGAMEVEVVTLIGKLENETATTVAGMTFHEGLLSGVPVVVVQCGVGKVSAAMCAQALIDRFGVSQVVNTGVAGALDTALNVGDVVISTDAVHHDMDVTGLGYEPGVIPELGVWPLRGLLSFPASEHLRGVMRTAAAEVAPNITVVEGRVASGDQFVCTREAREFIIATFRACCCEMEGTAIAHVCYRNEVPFVIVRMISDKADDSSTVEYREAEEVTAHGCAAIVERAVALMG